MPIYVFRCPNCKSEREVIQKFTDPAPRCNKDDQDEICNNVEMERIPARSNFTMEGIGDSIRMD